MTAPRALWWVCGAVLVLVLCAQTTTAMSRRHGVAQRHAIRARAKDKTVLMHPDDEEGHGDMAKQGAAEEEREEEEAEEEEGREAQRGAKGRGKGEERDEIDFQVKTGGGKGRAKRAGTRKTATLVKTTQGIKKHGKLYCPSDKHGRDKRLLHCPHTDGACCPTLSMCCSKGLRCGLTHDKKPTCVRRHRQAHITVHPNIIVKVPPPDNVDKEGVDQQQERREADDKKREAEEKDKKLEDKEEQAAEDPGQEDDKAGGAPPHPKHNSDFGLSLRMRNRNVFEGSPAPTMWPGQGQDSKGRESAAFKRAKGQAQAVKEGKTEKFDGFKKKGDQKDSERVAEDGEAQQKKRETIAGAARTQEEGSEAEGKVVGAAHHQRKEEGTNDMKDTKDSDDPKRAGKKGQNGQHAPRPHLSVLVNSNHLHHKSG